MIRSLAFGLLALATPVAAQDNQPAEAQMMRETWAKSDAPTMGIVQRVYSRVVSFELPRKFVTAYRQNAPGGYIVEYVPDGQTLQNWTQMITLTSQPGVGAAKVPDEALAAYIFNRRSCPGWIFRDLGALKSPTSATGRALVIGCDSVGGADYSKAVAGANERAAIAFLRDDENVWTIQVAERNLPGQSRPLFDPSTAAAVLEKLDIHACGPADNSSACNEARTISKATDAR